MAKMALPHFPTSTFPKFREDGPTVIWAAGVGVTHTPLVSTCGKVHVGVTTGVIPVPVKVTVLLPVKVAPLVTFAVPVIVPAAEGQNLTVILAAEPFETEKLLPDRRLNAGCGLTLTVPEARLVPETCCMAKVALPQVPTSILPKFREVGPMVTWAAGVVGGVTHTPFVST